VLISPDFDLKDNRDQSGGSLPDRVEI